MKIVKLSAENIKRLQAVEVTPTGDLVVIGGKNDAGKSSLLDAIEMALGGENATPAQPVRRGQHKAKVVLDLGDIIVRRDFAAGGQRKLVVENRDGARFPSPQAMLDKLYSKLSFDPLAFERQDAKGQAETLRRLVGLDTSDLDLARQRLYDERTQANREVKALEVKAASLTRYPDAPPAEIPVLVLTEEFAKGEELRRVALKAGHVYANEQKVLERYQQEHAEICRKIDQLQIDAAAVELSIGEQVDEVEAARIEAERTTAEVPDLAPIRERIAGAEVANEQVRTNRQYAQAVDALTDARKVSDGLTSKIEEVDDLKLRRLVEIQFPVDGLGIDDDGVTLGGLPFEQASTSDRIRVSVAIGLAMNPKLRVLLVRDGSLLGEEKLQILAEMAKAADAQVWLEMLQESPDARTSVYIEDGTVKKTAPAVTMAANDHKPTEPMQEELL